MMSDKIRELMANLHMARAVAIDPTLDPETRGKQLIIVCNNITEKMDFVFEMLDDIERHKPAVRDQVHALRIRLENLKLEFLRLKLDLNVEVLWYKYVVKRQNVQRGLGFISWTF